MRSKDRNATSRRRWVAGSCCQICGERIFFYQRFNWDHIVPMSLGGARGRSNKALSHVLCNSVKGSRHPFSLRTKQEREQIRHVVRDETWLALCRVWAGHPD